MDNFIDKTFDIVNFFAPGIGPGIILGLSLGAILFYWVNHKLGISKSIILVLSIWVTFNAMVGNFDANKMEQILSFLGSFIFAWLLTELSTEQQYKEKQNAVNMKSFRHSLKIRKQLNDTIKYLDNQIGKYDKCKGNNIAECSAADKMESVKNSLIAVKAQVDASLDDWSDDFSKELNQIKIISALQEEIDLTDMEQFCDDSSKLSNKKINKFLLLRIWNKIHIFKLSKNIPSNMINLFTDSAFKEILNESKVHTHGSTFIQDDSNKNIQKSIVDDAISKFRQSSANK